MPENQLQLSPLRSLDDFLLGSARFQLPNFKDLDKWNNRVFNNLLYYQTNYFLTGFVLILAVTILHPLKMIMGALALVVMYGLFYYLVSVKSTAAKLKKNHPLFGVCLIGGGACLVVYLLGSLLVFLFGILLPISATFVHASLRLRNMKNKIWNLENSVFNTTPMGIFLDSLGMTGDIVS